MTVDQSDLIPSVRVVGVYATRWRFTGKAEYPPISDEHIDQFWNFNEKFKVQRPRLPRRLLYERLSREVLTSTSGPLPSTVTDVEAWLFVLPSDHVVAMFAIGLEANGTDALAVTENLVDDWTWDRLRVDDRPLVDYFESQAAVLPEEALARSERNDGNTSPEPLSIFLPERHHFVLIDHASVAVDDPESVDRILYRRAEPYTKDFTKRRTLTLTDGPGSFGVITTYVSVLYVSEPVVRNSGVMSAIQAIGSAARFRQIWDEAYYRVREFRRDQQREAVGVQLRDELEQLADYLGNLEFDLTFSVEFPLMPIESFEIFHEAFSDVFDLKAQSEQLSQMFAQLGGSIRSEITAIDIRDRRLGEVKQRESALASIILSFVGVPIGFVLAYFGVNASQVDGTASMFSGRYVWTYVAAVGLGLIPASVIGFFRMRDRRRTKRRS